MRHRRRAAMSHLSRVYRASWTKSNVLAPKETKAKVYINFGREIGYNIN